MKATKITRVALVQIVERLATGGAPLVEATQIIRHCNQQGIDLQGTGSAKYAAFWEADLDEARGLHRLQKFKRGPTAQSRNAWCVFASLQGGRAWAVDNGCPLCQGSCRIPLAA